MTMTHARKCRLVIAMTALAAYPACADTPTNETVTAGPTTTSTSHRPQPADPTYVDWDGVARIHAAQQDAARAARSRPRPAAANASAPRARTGHDVWARLAQCESGGNPRAVSSSGTYRGAFQFSLATWRSVGMTGDPIDHSYGEQLAAAKRLQARSGWGQWPACSQKLGLR